MKTGRPKLKRGLAKAVQIGVRFTPPEYKEILSTAKRDGFLKGQVPAWIRFALLHYARSVSSPVGTFDVLKTWKTNKKPPKNFVGFGTTRFTYHADTPKKPQSIIPSKVLPVGTRVELIRPSMWNGYQGRVESHTIGRADLYIPTVVGLHIVRCPIGQGSILVSARFEELQVLSETKELSK